MAHRRARDEDRRYPLDALRPTSLGTTRCYSDQGDDEQDKTPHALLRGPTQRSGLAAGVAADSGKVVYLPMTAINGFEDFMIRLVD